ncbi:MAG: LPS assembly lipoprotein LptE [Desulforegulaceae bacterium]|nr:LPS assembly lipoprotein LptE [Desulforegulaceae bacterium]
MNKNNFFLLVFFVLNGCGYHFSGSGSLPSSIKKAEIGIFENRTGFSRIDTCMRDEFIREFSRYNILGSEDKAQGILKGQILNMSVSNPVKSSSGGSYERRITIVLNIVFEDFKGSVLFKRNNFSENYVFETSSDDSYSFGVPYDAMSELCVKVSRRIVMELTSDF